MHAIATTIRGAYSDSARQAWEQRFRMYLYLAVLPVFLVVLAITDAAAQTQLDFAPQGVSQSVTAIKAGVAEVEN